MENPTRENAAVLFLDLQDEIVKNSRTLTTAFDALDAGYSVQVAVDACGGVDARTEDAAWRRLCAAGGVRPR